MNQTNNCTHPQHNNYPIQGFCLNLECKFTSQCCSLCPQDIHKTHRNDCKNSVEVKKMIQNYYNMLCDWKKRLENTQQLEDRARKYIEKQTAIVIELHEKMKVKSLQTLNSQIKRIRLWNSHYTIGSKIANDNLQGMIQKLKNFEDQMMSIDNEFQQYEEEIEQEQFAQQPYSQSEKDHENTPAEKQMLKGFIVAILGLQLYKQKLYIEAIKCFDQAISLDPGYAEAYMSKGDSLHEMKKDEEALKCFSKAMQYFEGKGKIHQKLAALWKKGNTLQQLKSYDQAMDCYDQVLTQDPNIYLANMDKGILLQFLQKDDEAIKCFDLVIKACPSCFDAYLKKGVSLNQKKLYQEAIEQFNQALLIYPDFIDIYMEKALSLKQLKLYEESLACIEQALEVDPENKRAKKRKSFLLQKQDQQNETFNQDYWNDPIDTGMRQSVFYYDP